MKERFRYGEADYATAITYQSSDPDVNRNRRGMVKIEVRTTAGGGRILLRTRASLDRYWKCAIPDRSVLVHVFYCKGRRVNVWPATEE